jgi:hypothetical protein
MHFACSGDTARGCHHCRDVCMRSLGIVILSAVEGSLPSALSVGILRLRGGLALLGPHSAQDDNESIV